jgi:hypothetical protein
MNPQLIIDALTDQRNAALNQAAQALAVNAMLVAQVEDLQAQLAEFSPDPEPAEA